MRLNKLKYQKNCLNKEMSFEKENKLYFIEIFQKLIYRIVNIFLFLNSLMFLKAFMGYFLLFNIKQSYVFIISSRIQNSVIKDFLSEIFYI